MTWDQLASKVLHVNYQKKSGENGVYFDKAFNTVLLWAVAGANYGDDRTGCIIANGLVDGNDKINIMPMDSDSDTSYSLVNNGNQLFAQTHPANATHNTAITTVIRLVITREEKNNGKKWNIKKQSGRTDFSSDDG